MFGRLRAGQLNDRAREALARGDRDEAVRLYRKAIELAPEWSVAWFNLGLLYKKERAWDEAFRANQKAAELLDDPREDPALWNLGIAATAIGSWRVARRAWTAFGLKGFAASDDPPELQLGPVPIRVAPDDFPEVVWCDRIDPARAIVRNVPMPESRRRFGDVVLHDGAPNGYRRFRGQEVPVFDELERLVASKFRTFRLTLNAPADADVEALRARFDAIGGAAEDWSHVRALCKACSEGRPDGDDQHHHGNANWPGAQAIGAAAPDETTLRAELAAWSAEASGREVKDIELVF